MNKSPLLAIAVVRFQADELHKGWVHLLTTMQKQHDKVAVVIGVAPFPTPKNCLTLAMIEPMVKQRFTGIEILSLTDKRDDHAWSLSLDALIEEKFPDTPVVLCGSRRSFIPSYSGRFPTKEIGELGNYTGTQMRKRAAAKVEHTRGFRRGVIYAWHTRLAVTRPMVDVAVLKPHSGEVLLGRKKDDPADKWRFIGGLVDPEDESLEAAAKRETREEAGDIEIDALRYVCSSRSEDWRYKDTGESGMSALFVATYIFGAPRAGDDLDEVRWFPTERIAGLLVEEHKNLGRQLLTYLNRS